MDFTSPSLAAGVIAGSVNLDGPLLVCSSGAGTQTRWAQICRSVRDALARRSPVQQHADRLVGLAVPVVLALSLATVACWARSQPFDRALLAGLLARIGNRNAKGEYYLTDVVALAAGDGLVTRAVVCSAEEAMGVNSREQLAEAEAAFQRRARRRVMEEGATLVAPDTVWLSFDTVIGRDVIIEPNVFFGPGVVVEDGAHIMANCHMVGARIGKGARVGPFARFRPGADIGEKARVGNFVEVKNARLETGAKANHLAYIGDGRVGEGANIGAGTIFCNYDGYNKSFTDVGKGAFIGSNSSLVAPVKIGDGAYVGSGSVISRDVAPDSLALERSRQEERPGWAAKFRALMGKRKARS